MAEPLGAPQLEDEGDDQVEEVARDGIGLAPGAYLVGL